MLVFKRQRRDEIEIKGKVKQDLSGVQNGISR
jgi:hypothetical protein